MSRILGLDFGEKRIGVAVSDESQKIALPFCVLDAKETSKATSSIKEICERKNIKKIILGFPLTLKGEKGKAVLKTKEFAKKLKEKTNLPVIFEDERLTSKEAEKILREKNPRSYLGSKDNKGKIDVISATLILRQYLERE